MKRVINRFKKEYKRILKKRSRRIPKLTERDVFLVSYPRSGNTWVRFLIANVIKPENFVIDFHNIQEYVPELGRNNDVISRLTPPRVIKSHALYQPSFPKVIYLVRDGRDVYVSYYYYRLKLLKDGTAFSDFLRREDHYPSSWDKHIQSWHEASLDQSNILFIRYEDLLEDAEIELSRMMDFVGIEVSREIINKAIEDSKFDRMKKIDHDKGRKYNLTGVKDFIRKGKSGTWREEFSPDDINFFKETAGEMLIKMGYEKDFNW
jgi:hypothetical protein